MKWKNYHSHERQTRSRTSRARALQCAHTNPNGVCLYDLLSPDALVRSGFCMVTGVIGFSLITTVCFLSSGSQRIFIARAGWANTSYNNLIRFEAMRAIELSDEK